MTVELLKQHLRIESDSEDDYLALLLESAKEAISNRINQRIEGAVRQDEKRIDGSTDIPMTLQNATLIMAGTLYANREAVAYASAAPIPYSIEYLVTPYIRYKSCEPDY